jgi:hypothetical protein
VQPDSSFNEVLVGKLRGIPTELADGSSLIKGGAQFRLHVGGDIGQHQIDIIGVECLERSRSVL